MKYLFFVVVIGLMTMTTSCKYFNSTGIFGKKSAKLAALKAKQDSTRVADSIIKINIQAAEKARIDSTRKSEEERLAFENKFRYNIIVGSFITPEYANDFLEVCRQKGFESKIIKMEGSRFELVSVEAHESLRNAYNRLKEFQDTFVTDAWVYVKR
ncbi:MAG: hypothetical protein LLG13_05005 [Bacteroidales bacterium]|nr:hypothetical protein [Bacteroidales bacterium]